MELKSWGLVIGILSVTGLIGFIIKLIYEGLSKDKKIIDLEYKKQKQEIKNEAQKDSIDTIIKRILDRFKRG